MSALRSDAYTPGLSFTCTTNQYRRREDLQNIERCLISAIFPLCGNSAPGGYHHQPDLKPFAPVTVPAFDPVNETTQDKLQALNEKLRRHHEDARRTWAGKPGARISDAAAEAAQRNSQVLGLIQGGVGLVHVAKDITAEAFNADHTRYGYFGEHRGPGPAFTCRLLRHLQQDQLEAEEDLGAGASAGVGEQGGSESHDSGDNNDDGEAGDASDGGTDSGGTDEGDTDASDTDVGDTDAGDTDAGDTDANSEVDHDEDDERRVVGPFLDLWDLDLAHEELALALTFLCRGLSIYKPLVIVSESAQVSGLLALTGPSTIKRVPELGQPPTPEELSSVEVTWKPWARSSWWNAQGRVVISQYAPDEYALLAMVGHGGLLKYDPLVEREATRLLSLSNKAALVAYKVAAEYAAQQGRPDPGDVEWFQTALGLVQAQLADLGLDSELDDARFDLERKMAWVRSRRAVGGQKRQQENQVSEDDDVVFAGARNSPERLAQFHRLLELDKQMRSRGLVAVRNPARPAFCETDAQWQAFHLQQQPQVSITRSAAKTGIPVRNLRNPSTPWDLR